MGDTELVARAWEVLTNNRQCGGGTVKGRALAQRRVRQLGYRFFLAGVVGDSEQQGFSTWGMIAPGGSKMFDSGRTDLDLSQFDWIEAGVSLNHCAHKLGDGDASKGWARYWN